MSSVSITAARIVLTWYIANFINFLKRVKVDTVPTEMTFGVTRDHGLFEWAGTSLDAVFAQRKNIFSPRMWRMIFDIIRFNQFALDLLMADDEDDAAAMNGDSKGTKKEETIGEYLEREGYSDAFRDDYLIPMTAAVWSTSPDKCTLDFPAVTLVRFMYVRIRCQIERFNADLDQVESSSSLDRFREAPVAHPEEVRQVVHRRCHEWLPF